MIGAEIEFIQTTYQVVTSEFGSKTMDTQFYPIKGKIEYEFLMNNSTYFLVKDLEGKIHTIAPSSISKIL